MSYDGISNVSPPKQFANAVSAMSLAMSGRFEEYELMLDQLNDIQLNFLLNLLERHTNLKPSCPTYSGLFVRIGGAWSATIVICWGLPFAAWLFFSAVSTALTIATTLNFHDMRKN